MTVAPTIIAPMEGQQFNILEENHFSILCTATGYHPLTVIWKTNDNHGSWGSSSGRVRPGIPRISPTGVGNETIVSLTLTMTGATKEDAGLYRCVASNLVDSTIVTINVLCKFVNCMQTNNSLHNQFTPGSLKFSSPMARLSVSVCLCVYLKSILLYENEAFSY